MRLGSPEAEASNGSLAEPASRIPAPGTVVVTTIFGFFPFCLALSMDTVLGQPLNVPTLSTHLSCVSSPNPSLSASASTLALTPTSLLAVGGIGNEVEPSAGLGDKVLKIEPA